MPLDMQHTPGPDAHWLRVPKLATIKLKSVMLLTNYEISNSDAAHEGRLSEGDAAHKLRELD